MCMKDLYASGKGRPVRPEPKIIWLSLVNASRLTHTWLPNSSGGQAEEKSEHGEGRFNVGIGEGCDIAPSASMSLLNWNCRGLENPRIVRDLLQMVKEKKPHFLFLMETPCTKTPLERLRKRLCLLWIQLEELGV
jgi:hypothetical protein